MSTSIVSTPDPQTAGNAISNAITAEDVVIICCSCDVEYEGRAGGYLPPGKRTIMIKPDGNFLVIGSTKHKARNWQPTGADTTVNVEDETLILTSKRTSPREERLIVYCEDIFEVIRYEAGEDPDITLQGTEEDMHDRIMESPDLVEDGFEAHEHEKTVEFGRSIDIFGEDSEGTPVVVEVKRRRGQRKDVDQLKEYTDLFREDGDARGILVAPSVSDNVRDALDARGLEFVQMQPKSDNE